MGRCPVIGITMGDGAGVGPEIIVKALADIKVHRLCHPVVIGDAKILQRAIDIVNSDMRIERIGQIGTAMFHPGVIYCHDLDLLSLELKFGEVSAEAGNAAFRYLERAIALAREGQIAAICTAPINKEALHKAGHFYPGHTEVLAKLTGTREVAMLLSSPELKVIHVTTHLGLIEAITRIHPARVHKVIFLAHEALRRAGYAEPRIVVCGINPHAGENGLFGNGEEETKIVPAVKKAVAEGMQVTGPLPADTVFFRTLRGEFDVIVAMYHDQGHAPIKMLGMEKGVNITLGLPIIRTSVDHGTAFDIAGTGKADEGSLIEAITQAARLVPCVTRD